MKSFFASCLIILAAIAAAIWFGAIPINADAKPHAIEKWLAQTAVKQRLHKVASEHKNPFTPTVTNLMAGLEVYKNNCAGCHGVPKEKGNTFAESLYPPAPQFAVDSLTDFEQKELFELTKHGVRLSGMPAFKFMLNDKEIWKVVTFLHALPTLPYEVKIAWESK